ncbi:MAG TPA: DUF1345 domain-containing protein [Caulobacteraceae bacterium]
MIQKLWRPFAVRPRLTAALLVGALVAVILVYAPVHLLWSTRAVLAWDAALAVFIGSTLKMMCDCDDNRIRGRAAGQDEGQHFILILAVFAAFISILAIAAELSIAKGEHGVAKGLRVALAFVTVLASWGFVQMIFALHYAHEFYGEAEEGEGHRRGLLFPGDDTPDYWDFLHFGAVIGVAAQTADVAFASKAMRRTGTMHCLVAFIFNTVVLALTINLLAGLF